MRALLSWKRMIFLFAVITAVLFCLTSTSYASEEYITKSGFPDSYLPYLKKLHKEHPTWKFTPVDTGLTWSEAFKGMTRSKGVNTIWYSYAPSYKSVAKGCYNYLSDTYSGGSFKYASNRCVKYYMDPRNSLTETGIFMFQDKSFAKYESSKVVKKAVKNNSVLKKNASSFVEAGKESDVSSLYLAAKSYSEIGTSSFMVNGHSFRYGGKTYKGCYNAYNIGSSDSKGPTGGLIFANGGANGNLKTYGRKWNSVEKAIKGGAKYLKKNYISNGQDTGYTEHFNVMNGLSAVGTHIYMSSVTGPTEIATKVSNQYSDYGLFEKGLEFKIPVYRDMPEKACKKPSASKKKDNNYYLKELTVTGSKKNRLITGGKLNYRKTFTVTVGSNVSEITIDAKSASRTSATITGTGEKKLKDGSRTYKVVCKSSSGIKRTYKITVIKK